MSSSQDSFTFTVGKLDAGMAILLGERAHLIEFPSILLPAGATTGSIVSIAVHRNLAEEKRRDGDFWALQKEIYDNFGVDSPQPPNLELRNVTQTSVTLEWPQLHLATAKLRSLDIYRNGARLAAIPTPTTNTSTKLSGLQLDTDYTFQLVLRTTAGTFPSNLIRVRTHTMTDTSGISVCFGTVQDKVMLEDAKLALQEMRATWSDKIQIDTTHFVCTTPAGPGLAHMGPGVEYQRALQLSIPVVQPLWILACSQNRKMMPISQFYLGATPSAPLNSAPFTRPQSMSQVSLQRSPSRNAASPTSPGVSNRQSMPPARRATHDDTDGESKPDTAAKASARTRSPHAVPEADEEDDAVEGTPKDGKKAKDSAGDLDTPRAGSPTSAAAMARRAQRNGTMDRNFRFPPNSPPAAAPPVPPLPDSAGSAAAAAPPTNGAEETTAALEVPPPDPIEKERKRMNSVDVEEEIGMTEEISLN